MEQRPGVVDVDRHVQETWSIFAQYADPQFRDAMYRKVSIDGREVIALGDRPMPFSAAMWDDPGANEMFSDGRFAPNTASVRAFDPSSYLATMDAEGVDCAILAPTLALGNYSIPNGVIGSALSRAYARWVHEFAACAPQRLLPLYPVNLYDLETARRDVRWAVEKLGFRGLLVISLPVGQRPLHHPDFDALWDLVQALGVPIQLHTLSSLPDSAGNGPLVELAAGVRQFGGNMCLHHLASHRVEQHLTALSFLMGGVLARFPRLRVVFAEAGGGWAASWLDEMDAHFDAPQMRRAVPWLQHRPSDYFRAQCLLAFHAGEPTLPLLAGHLGIETTAWASDFPHYDSVFPGAVEEVRRQLSASPEADRARVLGGNASRFFGLAAVGRTE